MANQIGFYGSTPPLRSPEEIEAARRERIAWEKRKEREARGRAIQAAVDTVDGRMRDAREEALVREAAETAIDSILESLGDYSW